ncbi:MULTISPECIES: hypothetical protein [Aestuariibaculum]|uniref:DUF2069 domain-containing protein n=1 Tax=Aestuariibaculum lutulentum TaxID=2920935 RepID=A0ABS9REH4_9FLAO|nr:MULTISPECIES: hypothetical protein [Aestuariibaculum]MCH4551358.1 hypothetical protein [Aestuariibaculum lutulentum]MCR8666466.1 hypothetical protein [Aestuariibaculum sp. M13]
MKTLNKYSKFVPYLYFLAATAYWFTLINRTQGITAYPILLLGIPFLWQLIKPNKSLNFTLGITFVCLSSYLIVGYLLDISGIISYFQHSQTFIFNGIGFIVCNLLMALWIIRNSLNRAF